MCICQSLTLSALARFLDSTGKLNHQESWQKNSGINPSKPRWNAQQLHPCNKLIQTIPMALITMVEEPTMQMYTVAWDRWEVRTKGGIAIPLPWDRSERSVTLNFLDYFLLYIDVCLHTKSEVVPILSHYTIRLVLLSIILCR